MEIQHNQIGHFLAQDCHLLISFMLINKSIKYMHIKSVKENLHSICCTHR